MGGTETDPGIFINWTLRLGTTASRCITFNKFWPISRDLVFDIRILELWVVNEVFMKKRNAPKRDFYSTVVMWNRIGKHKAKKDHRITDPRYCYHNELNTLANDNHCSHVEIHETDERHFEPSDPSLAGTNNVDDELLIAIKNRLAGVPPMPGALSLKPDGQLRRNNQEFPMTSIEPHYLANTQSEKPKKVPTQVSTQVDDSMITEIKNQSTSTSRVKLSSKFTQSGIGLASQMEETAQIQHSTRRIQREEYQSSLPQEQNTQLHRHPSRILQSDEQYQQPLQPRRNSFPSHMKLSLSSPVPVSPNANNVDPRPVDVTGNSILSDHNSMSLPGVPDYYAASSQRPSVSRSMRSGTDEAPYNQQIHELSWSNRRNMGAILPYQQQLVRAAQDHSGDPYEDTNLQQSSQSRGIWREGSREGNREHSQAVHNPYQDRPSPTRNIRETDSYREPSPHQYRPSPTRSIREVGSFQDPSQTQYRSSPSRNIREADPHLEPPQHQYRPSPTRSIRENGAYQEHPQNQYLPSPTRSIREADSYQGPSQYQSRPSPSRSLREGDSYKGVSGHTIPSEGSYRDHSPTRVRLEPDWADSREAMSPPPRSAEQTVLAMTTVDSNQLCKCGSKQLNLVCSCKKSTLKEVEVTQTSVTNQCFRECRSPRKYDSDEDGQKKKKKKKDKKGKADKESKAEEKRRKKEEKEREKREKKEQKAREKESKKSKSKAEKKSKNKNKTECAMCSCCKCCGDEGQTNILPSETSQSEDTTKKKSKKEKKQKEKKSKEKKKIKSKEHSEDPPFRSCECPPPPIPTEEIPQPQQVQQLVQQQTGEEPSVLGYCNHPDIPCPALGNRETGQVTVERRKSLIVRTCSENYCRDPACTNAKRCENKRKESCCDEPKVLRSCCCCTSSSGGCTVNVCNYATMVEQRPNAVYPASRNIRGNSPSAKLNTTQNSRTSSMNAEAMRYRDITAAPALIYTNEVGHGDTAHLVTRSPTNPRLTSLPSGFSTNENLLIDLSKRGRENSTNKRYVPPCVLYLDCTKVKDLCVIIKDKYEENPS